MAVSDREGFLFKKPADAEASKGLSVLANLPGVITLEGRQSFAQSNISNGSVSTQAATFLTNVSQIAEAIDKKFTKDHADQIVSKPRQSEKDLDDNDLFVDAILQGF